MGRRTGRWSERTVKRFVMAIMPLFKYAQVKGHVDAHGRPMIRLSGAQWESAVGFGRVRYRDLRDALEWFEEVPDRPLASMWALRVPLDNNVPTQPLGATWEIMVMNARSREKRGAFANALRRAVALGGMLQ